MNRLTTLQHKFVRTAQSLKTSKRNKEGVCGSWSPREVIAHMAAWDLEIIRQYKLFREGLDSAIEHDIDAFNARAVKERENLSWEACLEELRRVHLEFSETAHSLKPAEIEKNVGYREWLNVLIEHYEHHISQLEKWL